ncbi:MAG TPA: DNA repair protein RecO [Geminicoccus sp.]|uniref:DNA repair protein RecO n=1 Tax=Geminicoccus sp. TaxID=2024832 RepID=UPI002E3533E2|nr:DNA repair protein RecO [Geminicoccus sp.]HEX2526578.1 DNA repair protein RecO [Geminicoccus sp.]
MEWQDEGFVLTRRRHGEAGLVVHAFTFQHGRHAGLVQGGGARANAHLWQPGNRLDLHWHARMAEQLGNLKGEAIRTHAADVLDTPLALAGLSSAMALLDQGTAERDPHPGLYAATVQLADALCDDDAWLGHYVRFELVLLAETGFGLSLDRCAVTGVTEDLDYVSPRTGSAVSYEAAADWAPRLLKLPRFLLDGSHPDRAQVLDGLRLAGHFLEQRLFEAVDRPVPPARERLVGLLQPSG